MTYDEFISNAKPGDLYGNQNGNFIVVSKLSVIESTYFKAFYLKDITDVFLIEKMRTMTMKGGNTDELYKGEGRLKMARMLEEVWPNLVKTKWRFGRPQHVVNWDYFKYGLIKSPEYKKLNIKDYGKLKAIGEIKSKKLLKLVH